MHIAHKGSYKVITYLSVVVINICEYHKILFCSCFWELTFVDNQLCHFAVISAITHSGSHLRSSTEETQRLVLVCTLRHPDVWFSYLFCYPVHSIQYWTLIFTLLHVSCVPACQNCLDRSTVNIDIRINMLHVTKGNKHIVELKQLCWTKLLTVFSFQCPDAVGL